MITPASNFEQLLVDQCDIVSVSVSSDGVFSEVETIQHDVKTRVTDANYRDLQSIQHVTGVASEYRKFYFLTGVNVAYTDRLRFEGNDYMISNIYSPRDRHSAHHTKVLAYRKIGSSNSTPNE